MAAVARIGLLKFRSNDKHHRVSVINSDHALNALHYKKFVIGIDLVLKLNAFNISV